MKQEETRQGWHRHSNGGGWVEDTATVAESAYVGPDAQVHGNARVSDDAKVYDNAQVYGNAWVHDNAWVYDSAKVYGKARVSGNAEVYDSAKVHGNAWVYDNVKVYGKAEVSGDTWVYGNARVYSGSLTRNALSISLYYDACVPAPGRVKIGCKDHTVEEWEAFTEEELLGFLEGDRGLLEEYMAAWIILRKRAVDWLKTKDAFEN